MQWPAYVPCGHQFSPSPQPGRSPPQWPIALAVLFRWTLTAGRHRRRLSEQHGHLAVPGDGAPRALLPPQPPAATRRRLPLRHPLIDSLTYKTRLLQMHFQVSGRMLTSIQWSGPWFNWHRKYLWICQR